jgi:hypothetical protein
LVYFRVADAIVEGVLPWSFAVSLLAEGPSRETAVSIPDFHQELLDGFVVVPVELGADLFGIDRTAPVVLEAVVDGRNNRAVRPSLDLVVEKGVSSTSEIVALRVVEQLLQFDGLLSPGSANEPS